MKFVDEVKITVASGSGGKGAVSFRREASAPRGGPDGGDGGKGGNVIFKTSRHINSLFDFKTYKKYSAGDGHAGAAVNATGPHGDNLILVVPEGTILRNAETNEVIQDLTDTHEFVDRRPAQCHHQGLHAGHPRRPARLWHDGQRLPGPGDQQQRAR